MPHQYLVTYGGSDHQRRTVRMVFLGTWSELEHHRDTKAKVVFGVYRRVIPGIPDLLVRPCMARKGITDLATRRVRPIRRRTAPACTPSQPASRWACR